MGASSSKEDGDKKYEPLLDEEGKDSGDIERGPGSVKQRSSKIQHRSSSGHEIEQQENGTTSNQQQRKRKATPTRLMSLAKPEWPTLALATLALVFSSIAQLSQPLFFGKIIQVCSSDEDNEKRMHRLYIYSIELLIILAFGGVFTIIRGWLFTLVGERLVRRLRSDLFQKIVSQDISFFDSNKTGELMNRLSSDTAAIQNCLSVNISMGLRSIAEVVVSIVLLFIVSWHLTLVMMGVIPLLMLIVIIYGRFTKRITKEYQDALAVAADSGTESLSNARIMKSFGAEEWESRLYGDHINVSFKKGSKRSLAYGVFAGGIGFLAGVAILVVVFYGATLVIRDEMDVGDLTSFILYTIYIAVGLGIFSGLYTELMNAIGASERIFTIIDTEPEIPISGGQWPAGECQGRIEFKNVNFTYPTRPDLLVLNNFSLIVEPNQTVALVGSSGSGKSTVLCLLERFYDIKNLSDTTTVLSAVALPSRTDDENEKGCGLEEKSGPSSLLSATGTAAANASGSLTVDGMDIRDIDPRWLHRNIAIVPQEPVLFSGSIKSNIMYSRYAAQPECEGEPATMEEVIQAGKRANAHDFIMGFPDGYETIVGERGVRLSGGQKQRVAIARALLANPRILLLDEATSALDSESEMLVQDAINELMQSRTVIIIAHRLSTVREADVIAVFNKGTIVNSGRHDELLVKCTIYANLVHKQLDPKRESERERESAANSDSLIAHSS